MAGKNGKTPLAMIDFQAFREERKKLLKPIVVKFSDTVMVELPPQMPATVMLDLMDFQREQAEQGNEADLSDIPADMAMGIMSSLLGDDRLREVIRDLGLDMDEVVWLMEQLMMRYMGDIIEVQQGNAATAPASRLTSSKTGA